MSLSGDRPASDRLITQNIVLIWQFQGATAGAMPDLVSAVCNAGEMKQAFCEWGLHGVEVLRDEVAALVIVDVLSFSTAVDVAVARGASIVPFPLGDRDAARGAAAAAGAVLAEPRDAAGGDDFTLSPASLVSIPRGTRLLLSSPNGARLSLAGGTVPVLTGCLRNAKAVAAAAHSVAGGGSVGVVPAGELWGDGSLRPAVEDLLGAGAILEALDLSPSPEALVAREAFRAVRHDLTSILRGSISGRELVGRGFAKDVELAAALNLSTTAPLLRDGAFRAG